jgi:ligand-binding SRPBCC domain-containing protein
MPRHTITVDLPVPADELFDFLARPANLSQLAPAEMRVELVDGPERIQLGTILHWKARRLGLSQALVNKVTVFEEGVRIGEEQVRGPFKRWGFTHCVETIGECSRVTEELTCEAPTGMLGLLLTERRIRDDLEELFAFRIRRLQELLG